MVWPGEEEVKVLQCVVVSLPLIAKDPDRLPRMKLSDLPPVDPDGGVGADLQCGTPKRQGPRSGPRNQEERREVAAGWIGAPLGLGGDEFPMEQGDHKRGWRKSITRRAGSAAGAGPVWRRR